MDLVPVRELQQHASAVLRRVKSGETVGITDRGALIAVLAPPSTLGGAAGLVAAGRVRRAGRRLADLPPARPAPITTAPISTAPITTAEVLDELRADR